ncbi:probable mediator of RNA polymerase II transcription subunit 26c isoform X2 [Salvia miltiorrhiza]|uniref:probable mediator of RNA polymerase II transcription subunit 26c isoform X2 n=1 Tax=Salvia miltiorrhiza TaxID=226208 RepID=UPI0025AB7B0D|nr:probable mediator of RNA polymerase II transcription subunit 26c isoform X2 [Salvia miltiorrhiza]
MDPEEFRAILSRSRAGIWALIEAAITVAGSDYGNELRRRRDKLVELLYAPEPQVCRNCSGGIRRDVVDHEPYFPENICNNYNTSDNIDNIKYEEDDDENKNFNNNSNNNRDSNDDFTKSPLTPESNNRNLGGGEEEEDGDPYGGLFDEKAKIFSIKQQLEDLNQSEDTVMELLQNLADMDITFQALKDTDIGRHVNQLRKHSSNEVSRLVKQLVRKWKETVNEWVKVNQPQATSNLIADGDSPQQSIPKNQQNGHHQVPDFGYSPNPQNGSSSVERKYAEHEPKPKVPDFGYSPNPQNGSSSIETKYAEHESKPKPPQSGARREALLRPHQSVPKSTSAPPNRAVKRESVMDDEKLNSARKRLQENYQEANNAKKQRTIQVMDIHDIPKPKNAFFAKNKGNFQGRHHR